MVNPNGYKYLYDKRTNTWGYEIGYEHSGNPHVCRIICRPTKGERRGVYQTRTGTPNGLHSFFDAKDDNDAGRAMQQMLEEALVEIRKLK
ncbi:Uncharacterised protein [uncultured archaeon]|nr:Uncharacterised protein [uncultured archaeon]